MSVLPFKPEELLAQPSDDRLGASDVEMPDEADKAMNQITRRVLKTQGGDLAEASQGGRGQKVGRPYGGGRQEANKRDKEKRRNKAKAECLNSNVAAVRLRGLPFSMSVQDVLAFFAQHDVADRIADGPQAAQLLPKANGRPSGQARVQMRDRYAAEVAQQALHNQWIGGRYIEVFVYGEETEQQANDFNAQLGFPPMETKAPGMPPGPAGQPPMSGFPGFPPMGFPGGFPTAPPLWANMAMPSAMPGAAAEGPALGSSLDTLFSFLYSESKADEGGDSAAHTTADAGAESAAQSQRKSLQTNGKELKKFGAEKGALTAADAIMARAKVATGLGEGQAYVDPLQQAAEDEEEVATHGLSEGGNDAPAQFQAGDFVYRHGEIASVVRTSYVVRMLTGEEVSCEAEQLSAAHADQDVTTEVQSSGAKPGLQVKNSVALLNKRKHSACSAKTGDGLTACNGCKRLKLAAQAILVSHEEMKKKMLLMTQASETGTMSRMS